MNAAALLALQDIDTALTAIDNRRPRLAELAARTAAADQLSSHRQAIAAVQQRIAAAIATIERIEHESEVITVKRTRLEAQLKTVIAPREAEALMHEISVLNEQRGALDEQELEALDQQGVAEQELAALVSATPDVERAADEAHATWQAATSALDAEAAALSARRVEAAATLDDRERAAYDLARAQHGGVAVARLEGRRCQGCHLDLSAAEMDGVKGTPAGELPECPQCGRYLVR